MKLLTVFSGAVLAGGASSRMGSDKAFVAVGDAGRSEPLVMRPVRALRGAGAGEVRCVGGDRPRLEALGIEVVADDHPGEGPLGGLITALGHARYPIVVVLTCDLVAITAPTVRALVESLDGSPDAIAAMPTREGQPQVLTAAYRQSALSALQAAFDGGERSVRRALGAGAVAAVDHVDENDLVDLDSPNDLENYASGHDHAPPGAPTK